MQQNQQEAMIITTGDICKHLDTKINEFEEKAAENLAVFKAAQKNILSEQRLELLAKDKMFNNNYSKDIKQYDKLSKEVMYSHHFRYRLEVGASCSIQLLL